MLPYPPPLPPLGAIVRVVVGALVAAAGLAVIAGPAPFCNILPLPLCLSGAALAVPPLLTYSE